MQAAQTGHLVLSTLHTDNAPSVVTRLMDIGAEPYVIASALVGVVAQRLVRRVWGPLPPPDPPPPPRVRPPDITGSGARADSFFNIGGVRPAPLPPHSRPLRAL